MFCPICGNTAQPIFQKTGCWVNECRICSHRYMDLTLDNNHVTEVYGDDYFKDGGAGYPNYLAESELLIAHGQRYASILKNFMRPGIMLDVGAAAGFILKGFCENGWQGMGLEPNLAMAEYGHQTLGLQIETRSLETFNTRQSFDLISMIQVLPHFYNLRQALENAAKITNPNGYWLVEARNKDSFVAKFLGKNWHFYNPPSVLHYFSPDTLAELMNQFGMVEVARGRPTKWLKGSHAKSILQHKLHATPIQPAEKLLGLIPDNLSFPYPNFDLFWGLYRTI